MSMQTQKTTRSALLPTVTFQASVQQSYEQTMTIFRSFTPLVEPLSLDEINDVFDLRLNSQSFWRVLVFALNLLGVFELTPPSHGTGSLVAAVRDTLGVTGRIRVDAKTGGVSRLTLPSSK